MQIARSLMAHLAFSDFSFILFLCEILGVHLFCMVLHQELPKITLYFISFSPLVHLFTVHRFLMIIKWFFTHYHNWNMNHRYILQHRHKKETREREKHLIIIFIQQIKLPALQNLPAEQTINDPFGGSVSPGITSQPMRCEEMLESHSWIIHVHIRLSAEEERYTEVLS